MKTYFISFLALTAIIASVGCGKKGTKTSVPDDHGQLMGVAPSSRNSMTRPLVWCTFRREPFIWVRAMKM